jgi:hypothetical protein
VAAAFCAFVHELKQEQQVTILTTFNQPPLAVLVAAGTLLLSASAGGGTDGPIQVPSALNPDRLSILLEVSARGVQIYSCAGNPADSGGWVLKGPDAQLFDPQNKLVGKHYAGPTWEDLQSGKVVGAARVNMRAPVDGAIPWLLLDVKSREGAGEFTPARAIVRMQTTGGTAPRDGCDGAHAGEERRVPYSAIYVFLK